MLMVSPCLRAASKASRRPFEIVLLVAVVGAVAGDSSGGGKAAALGCVGLLAPSPTMAQELSALSGFSIAAGCAKLEADAVTEISKKLVKMILLTFQILLER